MQKKKNGKAEERGKKSATERVNGAIMRYIIMYSSFCRRQEKERNIEGKSAARKESILVIV